MARTTNQPKSQTRTAAAKTGRSESAPELESVPGIRVLSFTASFHRAGFKFTREGIDLRLDDLTEEQVEAIAAEPMLSVRGIQLPAEPDCRSALYGNGANEDANTSSSTTTTAVDGAA